jgi:hypothetical protein
MKKIDILTPTDIRDILIKELRKRDKIISKAQVDEHVKQQVDKHMRLMYGHIDRLREEIITLKKRLK